MKIYLFLISCIPWWITYTNCLQTESDAITQVKFIVQEMTKVTSALNENDYATLVKVSNRVSTFAGVAGPAFALLAMFVDKGDPKQEVLMNEFKRVHEGIDALHGRIADLEIVIEKQAVLDSLNSNYQKLDVLFGHFERDEASHIAAAFGDFGNFDEMLNHFTGDNVPGITTLQELLYDHNQGDLKELIELKNFYDQVFFEAYHAFSYACYHVEYGKSGKHDEALSDCRSQQKGRYDEKLKKIDEKYNEIYQKCKVNIHDNLKNMIVKYLRENTNRDHGDNNKILMNRIKDRIQTGYFFVDAVVVVYDEIYGHDNHQISANIWIRQNGKNVVLMYDYKNDDNLMHVGQSEFTQSIEKYAYQPTAFGEWYQTPAWGAMPPDARGLLARINQRTLCRTLKCLAVVIVDANPASGETSCNKRYNFFSKAYTFRYSRYRYTIITSLRNLQNEGGHNYKFWGNIFIFYTSSDSIIHYLF